MEIEHFVVHPEHPLVLKKRTSNKDCVVCQNNGKSCDGCGYKREHCYGCNYYISAGDEDPEPEAYECAACNIALHKDCAEAPNEIIVPDHSQHPLTLTFDPSAVDGNDPHLIYVCSQCEYTSGINSVLRHTPNYVRKTTIPRVFWPSPIYKIVHKGHHHPLTLQSKEAMEFFCDGCGTRSEDTCFLCSECSFWIHRKCALLLKSIRNSLRHDCSLKLAYSFPKDYTNYNFMCNICYGNISHSHWLYYCGDCRYFVHVDCATTTPQPSLLSDEDIQNLDRFPGPDKYADLMSQLVKKMILRDTDCTDGEGEIKHWDHDDHPLTLWDDRRQLSKNNRDQVIVNYDGMLCEACTQPMTAPFYHCSQCSYFLHKSCALLPLQLPYRVHPDHHLQICRKKRYPRFGIFNCDCCSFFTNGFMYSSQNRDLKFCIHCANLPNRILHESHEHPLVARDHDKLIYSRTRKTCNACSKLISGPSYECASQTGRPYSLHFRCAMMLPHTLTHDYDKHPISLRYSPAPNHPGDYYCEICELDIDPTFWFYYCDLCQYSFHIGCIYPLQDDSLYSKVKFGSIYQVENHEHPLTFVRNRGNDDSTCMNPGCGITIDHGDLVLECAVCSYIICRRCGELANFVM